MFTLSKTRLTAIALAAFATDNGATIFRGNRTTVAPSGSFEVEVRAANRPGQDKIVGRATNSATGETCQARLTHP